MSPRQERVARRELLYSVVRESMVRAGVLSSSYKFKVLSLDERGRKFLVMMDLAQEVGADTTRLAQTEALIVQSAQARHEILVTAVYWRSSPQVGTGLPAPRRDATGAAGKPRRELPVSVPAPLSRQVSRPAELRDAAWPSPGPGTEPVQAQELEALQRALSLGARGEQALAAARAGAAQVPPGQAPATGFPDTELADDAAEAPVAQLSPSQYGELR